MNCPQSRVARMRTEHWAHIPPKYSLYLNRKTWEKCPHFFPSGPILHGWSLTWWTLQGQEKWLAFVRLLFSQASAEKCSQQLCQELRSRLAYKNHKGHLRQTVWSLFGTRQSQITQVNQSKIQQVLESSAAKSGLPPWGFETCIFTNPPVQTSPAPSWVCPRPVNLLWSVDGTSQWASLLLRPPAGLLDPVEQRNGSTWRSFYVSMEFRWRKPPGQRRAWLTGTCWSYCHPTRVLHWSHRLLLAKK